MKTLVIILVSLASAYAAPQGGYSGGGYPASNAIFNSQPVGPPRGGDCQLKVKCTPRLNGNVWDFVCENTNPCVIRREDILWLKGSSEPQNLNVVVPNYKLEEVIKAAFKGEGDYGSNVNILLKRPQFTVDAESQIEVEPAGPPSVNLEYEPVPNFEKIHYPVDRPYRPLSGPIVEPGAGGRY